MNRTLPLRLTVPLLAALLFVPTALAAPSASGEAANAELAKVPLKATPAEIQWFRDAKFGLFIHWGPASQLGVELSWGRKSTRPFDINQHGPRKIDPVYDNQYKTFNPVKFDAKEWVQIAKGAGMKYLVFTTKHHDGFSNFHTKHSDYNIANTPFKRDIVKELADACHKGNLKLGFYYSQRDWYHTDYLTENHDRYLKFFHGQMKELCTNYGKVDIMWFDSYGRSSLDQWDTANLFRCIRRWQPGIIINNRGSAILGGYNRGPKELWGDFDTPEQRVGKYQTDRPWESCITLVGHQWAYKPGGKMLSLKRCIHILVTCVCGDGNLLLNVGPMPTGEIEPRQVKRLKEIGAFLDRYGQSIYKTRGGPIRPGRWGGTTHRDGVIYVHVLNWNGKDSISLPPIEKKIVKTALLTDGRATVVQQKDGVTIHADKEARQALDTIVALKLAK